MAGGFFAFLLLPFICELPVVWGLIGGAAAFVLQLLWGQRLVEKLLRWEDVPDSATSGGAKLRVIASDCPMALFLAGIRVTRAAACCGAAEDMIKEWQKRALPAAEYAYLSRMLAVPCLLRAFEAVTNSYGRLRLSEGPLWYLGRFFALIAGILEWPLRRCWGEIRPDCRLKSYLLEVLPQQKKLPAWVSALDLLSPVCIAEVKRQRRWLLLTGASGSDKSADEEKAAFFKSAGFKGITGGWLACAGLLLALSPWQFWGALPLGIGLDCMLWFNRRWPRFKRGLSADEVGEAAGGAAPVAAVCWKGRLVSLPEEMAFERMTHGLRLSQGVVAVSRLSAAVMKWAADEDEVEICGWFSVKSCELQADRVCGRQKVWNNYFRWKYGAWPAMLAASGAAWWYLQYAGL